MLGLDFEADLRDSFRRGIWRRIPPKRCGFRSGVVGKEIFMHVQTD